MLPYLPALLRDSDASETMSRDDPSLFQKSNEEFCC